MTEPLKISDPDPRIAAWHDVWARNRAMIEGARTVKAAGKVYLPKDAETSDVQHANIIKRTPFTPGASRTHDGLIGLIFRKPATIKAPDTVLDILETITADGFTLDDLAEDVVSELLITNYVGLLTDYPEAPAGMSLAKALEVGAAPQIALYRAESILGVEVGKVNLRQRVVRVRLLEDQHTVRELFLEGGQYRVAIHRDQGGTWTVTDAFTPMKNGVALDEIPFSLVTTGRKYLPEKAKLEDVCDINAQHYIASSDLATASYWVGHPTPYLFGPKIESMSMAPGSFMSAAMPDGNKAKIGFLVAPSEGITPLRQNKLDLMEDMAKFGSRILSPEKSAVESGQTIMIKTASENAALASTARLAMRWINDQLDWVAWWLNLEEGSITYELNTDYGLDKLTPQERDQMVKEWMAGVYSKDTLHDLLIAGDALPEHYDRELDQEKLDEEIADRPPVDTIPINQDEPEDEAAT